MLARSASEAGSSRMVELSRRRDFLLAKSSTLTAGSSSIICRAHGEKRPSQISSSSPADRSFRSR